jgi:nucleotide-binding universal stress UspA family protein
MAASLQEPIEVTMFKNILLATDGSAASEGAAALAVKLARDGGARLTALYVIDPYPYLGVGEASAVGFQAYMGNAYEHAALAHARIATLCANGGNNVDLQLRRGEDSSAAESIVRTAVEEEADLIVVGSHGRTGFSRLMLGSVAAKVVAQSPLPVLVARQAAA